MSDIYEAPESDLVDRRPPELSVQEKLAQSRRDMEESSARERLNLVWGLRFMVGVAVIASLLYAIFTTSLPEGAQGIVSVFVFVIVFLIVECIAIIGYFKRKRWSLWPLHIFAFFSLFNFPFGTILSAIHYFSVGKLQYPRDE